MCTLVYLSHITCLFCLTCRLTCGQDSSKIFLHLGSHFFSQLQERGPAAVQHWTASRRKSVDIFCKKFITIVVNMSQHWSLITLVNPGELFQNENQKSNEEMKMPFILHTDSLRCHDGNKISKLIYSWLNNEESRLEKGKEGPSTVIDI